MQVYKLRYSSPSVFCQTGSRPLAPIYLTTTNHHEPCCAQLFTNDLLELTFASLSIRYCQFQLLYTDCNQTHSSCQTKLIVLPTFVSVYQNTSSHWLQVSRIIIERANYDWAISFSLCDRAGNGFKHAECPARPTCVPREWSRTVSKAKLIPYGAEDGRFTSPGGAINFITHGALG